MRGQAVRPVGDRQVCGVRHWHGSRETGEAPCRYDHDEAWAANMELFKHFTDVTQGVRRLGAAAVDMCHVALGVADAYWEYRLKPWDVAAGVWLRVPCCVLGCVTE